MRLVQLFRDFHKDESGQDLLEYVLVIAAVATAAVAGSTTLTNTIKNAITLLNGIITNAVNSV